MVLELRPAHDPEACWGYTGVVVSTTDLSASVWRWYRDAGIRAGLAQKVITILAEPADFGPTYRLHCGRSGRCRRWSRTST